MHECASFGEPALQALSAAFAAEDERVGTLPRDGAAGGIGGSASLLLNGAWFACLHLTRYGFELPRTSYFRT